MGFLDRLKASQTGTIENWKALTDINQLELVDELSKTQSVVLFKHSTSCGISAGAKSRLEVDWDALPEDTVFYYLDLLRHRDISNAIADRYSIRHESPQILVIKNGKTVFHASHHRINTKLLAEKM